VKRHSVSDGLDPTLEQGPASAVGQTLLQPFKRAPRFYGASVDHQGVQVKLCQEGSESFVLCRSQDRRKKEAPIHERFSKRIEQGLGSFDRRIKKSRRPIDGGSIERQLGRRLQRNTRASGRFAINLVEDKTVAAGLRLEWTIRSDWEILQRSFEAAIACPANKTIDYRDHAYFWGEDPEE
jgi:hypothetical protein